MADNNDKKVLKSSIEREQSQTCLNSAEREKIKGSTNLNVPHLRFPEFSGEWEKHTIGELAIKVGSGVTPKGGETVYKKEGHPFVRSQNVGLGVLLLEDIAYIDDTTHIRQKNTELQIDDVLLNITGASIGRCAVVNEQIAGGNVNQHVCIIRTKDNLVSPFLCNFLLSNYGQKQIDSFQAGGNRQGLNFEQIKSIKIGIPCLKEQSKIAKTLQLLDERIATQNKIIEKLESLIKGLSQRLLSPKQGWTSYKLDELCQIKSGYSGIQVSFQTAYKVSRIETISNHCINMSRIGFVKEIPQEYKLSVGDILFSNINSVQYIGNTAFIDKDYGLYHGMNLLRIVPDSRIVFPRFIHLLLCSERLLRHFQSICNKAVSQASINQTSLGKTMMTIPSYKEQQHICCIIESVERKLDIETSLLKMLQYQKQYLLRQMFI